MSQFSLKAVCILTRGPVSCGCHRKEGRRGDVLHEDAIHEDIWTTKGKEKIQLFFGKKNLHLNDKV